MSRRKPYRIPFVLEVGRPTGTTADAVQAQEDFDRRLALEKTHAEIEAAAREIWEDPHWWTSRGFIAPRVPFPGLKEVRKAMDFYLKYDDTAPARALGL